MLESAVSEDHRLISHEIISKYSSLCDSVVNKDLSLKAKAKAKDLTSEHVQGPSRTVLD